MLKKIQERIFPYLITITALAISLSAAYVSVIGLSKLFAGIATTIIIIASILEFSKLIIASVLYTYRKTLSWALKIYLSIAIIILMTITSIGIYGFLSSGYSETNTKVELVDKEIQVYKMKQNHFIESKNSLLIENQSLDNSINSLREGLSNNKTQYKDKTTGQIITTTSTSNRKSLETQLNVALTSKEETSTKLENIVDSISKYEYKIYETESKLDLANEFGPLKYISKITGKSMDTVVNWLMILLIIVFDPLAIILVVVSNFSFERLKTKPTTEQPILITPISIKPLVDEKNIKEPEIEEGIEIIEETEENQQNIKTIHPNYESLSTWGKKKIDKNPLGKIY